MKKLKKLFLTAITLSMTLGLSFGSVSATTGLEVQSIVANTFVGDGQREVSSFEIEVNDASLIADLTADDFDITNNVSSIPYDLTTGEMVTDYVDDGISIAIEDNTIVMNVKSFDYTGKYNADFTKNPWQITCEKYPELSFNKDNVTELKTRTLDNVIRGEYTYAGLTREYALYLPKNSNGSYKTDVPLVVWNHGGGEYAGEIENTLVANRGLTAWVEAGYETAVLEVQISNENYSYGAAFDESKKKLIDQNNALQADLIKQLINDGYVDANRVYVTGASSGGGATMRFAMQYPELFAGAIACCSMDPIVWVHFNYQDSYEQIVANFENAFQGNVYTWDESQGQMVEKAVDTQSLINLPIYFTHAENDTTCSVTSSKAMYEALNNLGAKNNHLTVWSDSEMAEDGIAPQILHWSWVKVLNHNEEGSPMNWLFKQSKEVTEVPETPTVPETPVVDVPADQNQPVDQKATAVKTGDSSNSEIFVCLAGLAILGGYLSTRKRFE